MEKIGSVPSAKIIALANANKIVFYEAKGLGIVKGPYHVELESTNKKSRNEKRQGFFQKGSLPGSFFDPHTAAKDLEHNNRAKEISKHLEEKLAKDYNELIILADPKLLGYIKQNLKPGTKKHAKFIAKDLTNECDNIEHIKQVIFS